MKKIINYSGIPGLILISALFFLPVSCNKDAVKDNPDVDNSSQLIKVSGEDANAATKTTLNGLVTSWKADDQVGIYSPLARTTLGGGTAIANVEFHAASSGVSSNFTGTMYWGAANTPHIFYAYYPYNSGYRGASDVVPISLLSAQIQSAAGSNAHISALDFMVATPVTVTSPANTSAIVNEVNLRYNHVFTVLEFQIKGSGLLKAVKLSGSNTLAFSGGTIDITQTTPASGTAYALASTGTATQCVVTLTNAATLTANATTVYMVINPGTQTGNCLIGLSDGTTWTYISKAAPEGGFLRGKKYVVTIEKDQYGNFFSTVTNSKTGKTWMDRNLGATQVAISSTDEAAYGYLYQWGRGTDGHQIRTSATTSTLSSTDAPGHGSFILASSDWRSPQNTNLWQGVNGVNNPCPSGYRVPTDTELNAESSSWGSQNAAGAFASPLKWSVAGFRYGDSGLLNYVGDRGYYWSSTVNGSNSNYLVFGSDLISINPNTRNIGFSVRCIKAGPAPDAPTIGTATAGNAQATVTFTAPGSDGGSAITGYTVTSSPGSKTGTGTASSIIVTGLTNGTAYTFTVTATNAIGTSEASSASNSITPLVISVVTNPTTGKTWMDRNLGATRVATSSADENAYGYLYQWGRGSDGHQIRTSAVTVSPFPLSSSDSPGHSSFILAPNSPFDWRSGQNVDLWQGMTGTNNPCPSGFRLPTEAELDAERASWSSQNSAGAYASPLKFTVAGLRNTSGGSLLSNGSNGYYWSSTAVGANSYYLDFNSSSANMEPSNRAYGFSVRCIKD